MKSALLGIDVQVRIIDLLKAEQIIAHHNRALNGFSSGKHTTPVKPASKIYFGDFSPGSSPR